MEKITVIGLDLAKNVFQVHGADAQGKKLLSKQFKRAEVLGFFARLPACRVGMEACGGAHDWARRIAPLGHQVKLMAPQPWREWPKAERRYLRTVTKHSTPGIAKTQML